MCGIGGVLRIYEPGATVPPHHESIPDSWLDTLDDAIKHRGPDGAGRFRDRAIRDDGTTVDVALVHRRLSIIDHEGGAQPMVHRRHPDGTGELLSPNAHSERGPGASLGSPPPAHTNHRRAPRASEGKPNDPPTPRSREGLDSDGVAPSRPNTIDATNLPQGTDLVAVAFNGCIYNHRALRDELEQLDHRFETDHADTEVLIHGWRAWGLRTQDELDGMYAALIWDRRTGQLAWGRDLAGEKPLSEIVDVKTRVFSSSPNALARFHAITDASFCKPYEPGLEYWICDGAEHIPAIPSFNQSPGSFHVIPNAPTHGGEIRNTIGTRSVIAIRKRQTPTRNDSGRRFVNEFPDRCIDLIESAVTSRLEADVPLGLFLSGGLDSALIAAIAVQHRPDINAFTVRMPEQITGGPHFDESEAAAETAAHLGLTHHILDCDATNAATDLVALIEQLGLPFGDSSLLPTHWVCRAAREHVTVALSGDGGDELFGGYARHAITPTLNRYRRILRLIPDALLPQKHPGTRSTYLARLAVAARHGGYSELLSIFPTPDLRKLISEIDGEAPGDDDVSAVDDPLRYDFLHYLPDDLLRKTDTASMAVALEVRAPFLARDLVDAALRTPLDVLMPKGERKGLLKQVARAYLPDHVINRPKQGFAIPIGAWFRSDFGGLRQLLHDHLRSADPFPGLADAGVNINTQFVEQMLRDHDAAGERSLNPWHGRDHSQRLYMLLVLSIWCRWLDRTRREAGSSTATTG